MAKELTRSAVLAGIPQAESMRALLIMGGLR